MAYPKLIEPQHNIATAMWGVECSVVLPVNIYRCTIGDRVRVGPFVEIQDGCLIDDDTVIGSHSFIAGGTKIGKRCFIGHGVITANDRYPVANNKDWEQLPPTICDDVSIGSGAIILPGIWIGPKARIGAGMVVTEDVKAGATVSNVLTVRERR